ncbi:AMP-binding protein [Polynucleobacter paneuropaeus]|uniref:AMP-binding protein n=1 Tax=Polynucleobacter paneuropaeus TaxID=2527775 RepID=UPI001BFD248A|nr:AMP-binding protein [Polynucleobacter paneuropaeus]QWD48039.1 AMP-binding protein [Polynucleobacter paneuropaeus]QWD52915.1 AMP-binding protein [Polynucleobacter paneuropaeus]QWD57829.1 AMP-binding protein [Polynucleobacter paneuropaeus]
MFVDKINTFSDRTFIQSDVEGEFRYSELKVWAAYFGEVMGRRSLVFCLSNNSLGSIAGYMAFMASGNVPLLLDVGIDLHLLEKILANYRPQFVWRPQGHLACGLDAPIVLRLGGYELVEFESEPVDLHPDLGLLLSTSGSTGSPKLVRLSYQNIESNARSISQYLNLSFDERPITSLPSHYSYGLSVINSHFYVGATLLATNASVMQREFWDFTRQKKATSIAGVPYTYEMLRRLRFFSMDLPDLRTLTQAGGHLQAEFAKEFLEYAKNQQKSFVVMYGQTEATPRMGYLNLTIDEDKLGSIGKPIPGGKFQLLQDDGSEIVESGRTGNLIYSGPNVSLGYAECREDLSLADERGGVLDTGDLAYRDDEGFYYINGRKNRFVKVYGNRLSLDEVEVLAKMVCDECACLGEEDLIHIFITDPDLQLSIRNHLVEKTGLNQRAFKVAIISEIPRNSAGKIQYGRLQEALA